MNFGGEGALNRRKDMKKGNKFIEKRGMNRKMKKKTEREVKVKTKKKGFLQDNAGVGVVEIILILVVLIALILIFKNQLTAIVTKAMSALEKSVDGILP